MLSVNIAFFLSMFIVAVSGCPQAPREEGVTETKKGLAQEVMNARVPEIRKPIEIDYNSSIESIHVNLLHLLKDYEQLAVCLNDCDT